MRKIIELNFINSLILLFSFIQLSSCAINPVTGKKQLMLMSEAQEIRLGTDYDPEVTATFGLYNDARLSQFLQMRGDEMGKISHRPNLKYNIKILDSPVVNAFAVPGGYIYFTRGILAQFNSEAEVMGVLGHEMGHITARHTASSQSKQQIGQILLVGGMIASPKFAQFGEYALQGMQLLFLKFSRDNEREADRLGVEYASKIRYDAQKMAEFFNVLDKLSMSSEVGGVPTFLSTHPNPADRYNSVLRLSRQWQEDLGYSDWQVNRDSYLKMIDGLVYGEDPRQGFVDGGVFYHPEMKFRFPVPSGWRLENSPIRVQMGPADGRALIMFMLSPQRTAVEAAETALKDLNLTLLESKRTTVSGLPAVAVVSQQASKDSQTGQQQVIKVLSYFIEYDGAVYLFHGVANEPDFNSYFRVMESTMGNFGRLTDPSKLNVRPEQIRIKAVLRSATTAEALSALGVTKERINEVAMLNNLELNEPLQAGRLIKVIEK